MAAQTARLGPDHPDTFTSRNTLANVYRDAGQNDRGDPDARADARGGYGQARPRPPQGAHHAEHPGIGLSGCRLVGPVDPAPRADGWRPRRPSSAPTTPTRSTSQNNLANAYRDAGRNDLAIPMLERTLATADRQARPSTTSGRSSRRDSLASAYRDAGSLDRSIPLLERTLAAQTAKLGSDHPDTLTTQNNLANAYRDAGQFDRAISDARADAGWPDGASSASTIPAPSRPVRSGGAYQTRGDSAPGRVVASRRPRRA